MPAGSASRHLHDPSGNQDPRMLTTHRGPRDAYSQGRGERRRHRVVLGGVFAAGRAPAAAGQRDGASPETAAAGGRLGRARGWRRVAHSADSPNRGGDGNGARADRHAAFR